ncbi:hypothetical protein GGS20DRAFT_479210 [Poronia punctata]|nr:hypothetical protein GGS20DRAFT_479210 [Poronia punctata]
MKVESIYLLGILLGSVSSKFLTFPKLFTSDADTQTPLIMDPVGPAFPPSDKPSQSDRPSGPSQGGPSQGDVLISDVMGRDRSINVFAGFARDVVSISNRFDSSTENSTVLAPLNSAVEKLPGKPWENAGDYNALGANAYEGQDGQDRAHRNLRRFVEAHIIPVSPWVEKQKTRSLLDGDKEIWWETKDGVKVLQPEGIEVQNVASQVGNGEVWIIKSVRNYA